MPVPACGAGSCARLYFGGDCNLTFADHCTAFVAGRRRLDEVRFWSRPFNNMLEYGYAAPEPAGFAERRVRPQAAYYHPQMKEFLLMYDNVRAAASPRDALMQFLQSTYDAAAECGQWDRKALERPSTDNKHRA